MRFTYAYKTSDGTRHEAAMDAESREAVFAALRTQGIRAIKVVAADGSKANGEVRGRKRVFVLGAVCLVLGAAVAGAIVYFQTPHTSQTSQTFDAQTRRQVIGDTAVIEKGIRTGWADVFATEGERFLASFAIPGVKAGQRSTTEEKLREALHCTPTPSTYASGSDGLEARQIRAMVEGMKDELRRYLAAGGTIIEYGRRLVERQDAEIAIYERTKAEIEDAKRRLSDDALVSFWEERNDRLRNLGIRLISLED